MKVSRHPCRKLLSPLKPSFSLLPASPSQHLTSAFSHSSTLFCTRQKLNSFLFKQFRTLSQKHPGWGTPPARFFVFHSLFRANSGFPNPLFSIPYALFHFL